MALERGQHKNMDTDSFIPSRLYAYRSYRISGSGGMVEVWEHGHLSEKLFLSIDEPLPKPDVVAMLRLWIEADEVEFLRIAIRHNAGR